MLINLLIELVLMINKQKKFNFGNNFSKFNSNHINNLDCILLTDDNKDILKMLYTRITS